MPRTRPLTSTRGSHLGKALLGFALVVFGMRAAGAEPLDAILKRMDAASKTAKSFAADVRKTDYTSTLGSASHETGTVKLKRNGDHVEGRLDMTNPEYTWHFGDDTWEQYRPKMNILEVWNPEKFAKSPDRFFLLAFGTSGKDLKGAYDIKAGGEETIEGVRATHLELTPKEKAVRKKISKVEVWIVVGQAYSVQVKVNQTESRDYTIWTYPGAKVNPGLPDAAFEFTRPKGVQVMPMN